MKFSTTITLALAPLAMARKVRNVYRTNHAVEEPKGVEEPHKLAENSKKIVIEQGKTEIILIWANPGGGAATTTINEKVTVTQTVTKGADVTKAPDATKPAQAAASHTVTVGGPGGLIFQPDQLNNVPIGDTVVFEFLSQNHTVTQSPFDTPCDALPNGMDSGFMPNPENSVSPPPQVAMQVMVDTPLWFYCKQGNHCGAGMVFSINPTAAKTQAMFLQKAIEQKGNGKASPITGGAPAAPPAESPAAPPAGTPAAGTPTEGAAEQPAAESPATGSGEATPGKGTLQPDGSCQCVVTCAAGSFPAIGAQGVGAFGGMGGGLPMAMAGRR